MSGSPPTTLGKYQIIREIARSNDIVYEAYDPLMNRRVAVKELAMPGGTTSQQQDDRINRFKREAQAVGTLAHANIMTVFEYGQEGDRHYMAMEYLDGHTLRNEIDTKGFLPPERAIDIAIEICQGLAHAHSKGVIHRDIKPDNIQILSNDTIKITDFGIARLTFQPNLTMDGQVFGTPSYMSPEQVVGREIDARSDLFSVGVVLYEMIGGQKPFAGDSVVSITYAIMNKEPDKLAQANYGVQHVLSKALDKSPALRYNSATEMIEALKSAKDSLKPGNMVIDPPVMHGQPQHTIYGQVYPPQPSYTYPVPGQPLVNSAPPPPVMYPYNPYSNPQAGGSFPHSPGFPPGYIPPPFVPPQPLLKPETKRFLKTMLVSFIVLGSAVLLILVAVQSLGQKLNQNSMDQNDRTIIASNRDQILNSNSPTSDKIHRFEEMVGKLRSSSNQKDEKRTLAALYEKQGKEFQDQNDFSQAEDSFKAAIDADPDNHRLYSNLGVLFQRMARQQGDINQRAEFAQKSVDAWTEVASHWPDRELQSMYGEPVAASLIESARNIGEANQYGQARGALYTAQRFAPPTSSLRGQIDQLMTQLGGDGFGGGSGG